MGKIILINGTSSVWKSTFASDLHNQLPDLELQSENGIENNDDVLLKAWRNQSKKSSFFG